MNKSLFISLVIPCYNEEANIKKGLLEKVRAYVSKHKEFISVIIVDDGSTDSSVLYLEKYCKKNRQFRLIKNKHQGKAFAVITGIREAEGDYVLFSDFDFATPIEEAGKLISCIDGKTKIIIGTRNTHRQGAPLIRKIMALGYMYVRDLLLSMNNIVDTQCGFKMFEKKAALEILSHLVVFKTGRTIKGSSVSAGFDVEFLYVAQKLGYSIKQVPVEWRHAKSERVSFIHDSLDSFFHILRIKLADIKGQYNISKRN